MGQDRGGFYSYDAAENLLGLGIRSAERIEPAWQDLQVGDAVLLAPQVPLDVVVADRDRALVLRTPDDGGPGAPYDFTWAFVLQRHRTARRASSCASGTRTGQAGRASSWSRCRWSAS